MSFDVSRFDRSYFDVDTVVLPCSTMVISDEIYNLLAGNIPGTVEYFADVRFGDSDTPLPYVDMITIEREMGQLAGTLHVGFMDSVFPVSGLAQGSKITVEAGMRFSGKTAYQKIFHGRIQKITYPSAGESARAYLDAYDAGKDLMDEAPGIGYNTGPNAANLPPVISGDVFLWMALRLETLATAGVTLYLRTPSVDVPANTLLAYRTLGEAVRNMANAYDFRYVFITGANQLAILDPAYLASTDPLFKLASAGISRQQQIDSLIDRVNRVPYQKAGNTADASIFWVGDDGVLHQTAADPTTAIIGTYNDATDQADFPVLASDTLRNDIVTTAAEFEAIAAAMADETQRERHDLVVRFNPFVDLGDVIRLGTSNYFVYRVRHDITAGNSWETKIEVRKI